MNNRIKVIIGALAILVLGFYLGQNLMQPERVIFHESNSQAVDTGKPKIIPAGWTSDDNTSLQNFNEAFVQIAENVTPSVVTITTETVVKSSRTNSPFDDEFFRQFFNVPDTPQERRGHALGSGVIVDSKGYILTNNHVVENAEKINVELIDGREFKAEVIGKDPRTDLAVIKIDAKELTPAVLGDSEALRVGEWVVAIGSPLSPGLAHTVTSGIVSAKGRNNGYIEGNRFGSFIQTDAAINPGNSGGALVNIRGELIGINAAIATDGMRAANIGIGFAIPVNLAKKVMKDLIEKGKVERAWLGVQIQSIDDSYAKAMKLDTRDGALISQVVKGSPAEKGGLKIGDFVIKVDGKKVNDSGHLQYLIGNLEIGETVTVTVIRKHKEKEIKIKLGEYPEDGKIASSDTTTEPHETSKIGIVVEQVNAATAQKYNVDADETGVVVTEVESEGPARGTLRQGDILKRIGDKDIEDMDDYKEAIDLIEKEDYILILVKRDGNTFFVTLEIEE